MSSHRRAARRRGSPPATSRELLAYAAGRRLRRTLALPIGRLTPVPEEVDAALRPGELELRSTMSEARWWRLFWRGWREAIPDEP